MHMNTHAAMSKCSEQEDRIERELAQIEFGEKIDETLDDDDPPNSAPSAAAYLVSPAGREQAELAKDILHR